MEEHWDLLKQLEARARELEAELAGKQERLRELQAGIRASQAALEALTQVIAYERAGRGHEAGDGSRVLRLPVRPEEPVTQGRIIADAAYAVLETEGPLHYRDLTRRLLDRGVSIGGYDPNAGVVGALVRDGRFYRQKRGVYYPRDLAKGPIVNVGQRRKRGA